MQVGWQGLCGLEILNLHTSPENTGGLAGSRWGGRVQVGWQTLGWEVIFECFRTFSYFEVRFRCVIESLCRTWSGSGLVSN